jgi:hypothetical protein
MSPGVISAVLTMRRQLPVYPDERTLSVSVGMSQRCHFRTHAAQQNGPYSITSSAIASRVGGTVKPSDLAVVSQLDCGEAKITARFSYRPALLGARTKSNLFQ